MTHDQQPTALPALGYTARLFLEDHPEELRHLYVTDASHEDLVKFSDGSTARLGVHGPGAEVPTTFKASLRRRLDGTPEQVRAYSAYARYWRALNDAADVREIQGNVKIVARPADPVTGLRDFVFQYGMQPTDKPQGWLFPSTDGLVAGSAMHSISTDQNDPEPMKMIGAPDLTRR